MALDAARFSAASAALCARDGIETGELADSDLVALQRDVGQARRALDVLAAEVAGEIQRRAAAAPGPGGIARLVGYPNARALIADTLGTSSGEASRLAAVGDALALADAVVGTGADAGEDVGAGGEAGAWALVAAAVRDNTLTVEKADILLSTLNVLRPGPEVEEQFVRLATRLRPYELRRACAREIAINDPASTEERERRHYDNRRLDLFERMDGMTVVQGLLDPLSASHLRTWLDAQVKAGFRLKRDTPGDNRTATQMRVDALATLAHHAMACDEPGSGAPVTMVVRVALEDLKKGVGIGSCDALQTPISVSTLRAMAVDAQVIPVVMGGESVPLDVGRASRLATPYQAIALAERDGGCAWCHAPISYCDKHHIQRWEDDGLTNLENMVMLCVSCHHRIHFGGWTIEVIKREVWFTPPAEIDPTRTPRKGGLAHFDLSA